MRRALAALAIVLAFVAVYTLSRHGTGGPPSTTTSVSPTSSSTSTSLLAACQGSDFHGAFNQGQGAAGTIYASVTLTKTSLGLCQVKGWPRLTLQDKYGTPLTSRTIDATAASGVQFPDSRANGAPARLALHQGSTITFSLLYSDVPTGAETCPAARTVSVAFAPNGSTTPVTPEYPPAPCNAGTITVSPFY